jgi:hypothetical protein
VSTFDLAPYRLTSGVHSMLERRCFKNEAAVIDYGLLERQSLGQCSLNNVCWRSQAALRLHRSAAFAFFLGSHEPRL